MSGRIPIGRADDEPPGAAMNCHEFEPFVCAYVDNEFDGPERSDAEAHLATCEPCRREVEAQRAFKQKLRQSVAAPCALNPPAPAHLRANILAALDQQSQPRRLFVLRPAFAIPAGLAAAAAIAALIYSYQATPAANAEQALIDVALFHHQGDLPLDVQSEDPARVRESMRPKLDFSATRIPELHNASLRGARLSQVNGHPAAFVVYGSPNQRRVSLLVFNAPELRIHAGRRIADRDVMLANQRGFNVAVWKEGEIAYSLVDDTDEKDILDLLDREPALRPASLEH